MSTNKRREEARSMATRQRKTLVPTQQKTSSKWKWTGFAGKTMWDWLQLLIIPLVLAGGGFWFSAQQNQTSLQVSEKQYQTNLQIADDQQQETILKSYLDDMSDLLLNHNLRDSKPGDEVRQVARERTLTTLRRLRATRNQIVLQFLQDAHLISVENAVNAVIDLSNADLSGDDLSGVNLSFAVLRQANLSGTHLSGAYLAGADLSFPMPALVCMSGANLSNADLRGVNLSNADLINANLIDSSLTYSPHVNRNLHFTNLSGASLEGAFLADANLSGASLGDADLSQASLSDADLSGAFLGGANLSSAFLYGANLRRAIGITTEELEKQAESVQGTIMPDGTKHP